MSRNDGQRILASAAALHRREGEFTMAELARAAGVSRATVYRHVGGQRRLREQLRLEPARTARDRLLAAARELLAERGVDGFSLELVAAAAGVSSSTLFREFPDRSALLAELLAGIAPPKELLALLQQVDSPPEVVLPRFAEAMRARLEAHPYVLQLLWRRGGEDLRQLRRLRRAEESVSRALLPYLEAQIERGRLRRVPPEQLASLLLGAVCASVVAPRLMAAVGADPAGHVRALVELILRGAQRRRR